MRRACLIVLALAQAAGAVPAAGEMPDPGLPEGAERTLRVERADATYALPVGRFGPGMRPVERLRGRAVWQAARLDDPEAGTAAAIEGYRGRLAEMGFAPVFECRGKACGGLDFRFGAELLPAPAMLMDTADFAQLSMARGGDAPAHVSVLVSRVLGALHVQTVTVVPDGAPLPIADSPPPATGQAAPPAVGAAAALGRRLEAEGHVRIDGIDFETGGARLSRASDATLDALAAMLLAEPAREVIVVGHSDSQGGLDLNLKLSRDRAEAVRAALVARGVPEGQVSAEGIGFLAPLASNATEAGRARNRRVELVLR